jgi:hypothetical protein
MRPELKPSPKLPVINDSNAYQGNVSTTLFLDLAVAISVYFALLSRPPVKSLESLEGGGDTRHSDVLDYHDAFTAIPVPSAGSSVVPTSSTLRR